jgi:serine/threonine-protein phosphatase 4 regulatory subunit 4
LYQDVEPEVRTTICRHLPFVARGVGLDLTKSAVLPAIVELSGDEEGAVRLAAVETVVHLLSLLDDEVCSGTIVPLVMRSCEQARSSEDCSLPAIARHLGRLCHGLTPNLRQEKKEEENLKRGIWAADFQFII